MASNFKRRQGYSLCGLRVRYALPPLYPNSKITNLFVHGGTLYFTVDKLDNSLETWTLRAGKLERVNVDFPAIQSIAVSPTGTVAELKVSSGHQTIVTVQNGQETDLHFPGHASKIGYSPSGVLTTLTNKGVWIYQHGWKEIQLINHGTVESFYWTKDGTLYL
jgi:hypothetical protein